MFFNGLIIGVTAEITFLIKDKFFLVERKQLKHMCFVSSKEPWHRVSGATLESAITFDQHLLLIDRLRQVLL